MYCRLEKIVCTCIFLGLSSGLFSQIYRVSADKSFYSKRAYQTERKPQRTGMREGLFEAAVGAAAHAARFTDPKGYVLSDVGFGGGVRLLYYVSDRLALGVQAEHLEAKTSGVGLMYLREERYAGAAKWILSGETQPLTYLAAGAGVDLFRSKDTILPEASSSAAFLFAAWGMEFNFTECTGLALEYTLTYVDAGDLDKFIKRDDSVEQGTAARLFFRF